MKPDTVPIHHTTTATSSSVDADSDATSMFS